jgi:hypothetical protein
VPGNHQFTVSLDGYHEQTVSLDVEAGRTYDRHVHLIGIGGTGTLWIQTSIAGATVSVDGLVAGTTSASAANDGAELRLQLDAGEHDIIVERGGARSWHDHIHVSPGETIVADVAFRDTHVSRTKALTWGLAGVGVASLATGGTLGVMALRDVTSSNPDDHDRGKTRALVTDLLIVGGAVALYGAWRLSKREKTTATVRRTHTGTDGQ